MMFGKVQYSVSNGAGRFTEQRCSVSDQAPVSPAQLVRRAVGLIRDRLPSGWHASEAGGGAAGADAAFVISAADGREVRVEIEAKQGTLVSRQAQVLAQELLARAAGSGSVPLLVARYLSPQVREQLQTVGVSYVDATGNMMLSAVSPGLYLADRGAGKDPWRGVGRPRGTLKGDPAALVVRALLDAARPWRVRDLVESSGASTGATYRVLEYLDQEGLAGRDDDGLWAVRDWQRLLRAWAADYSFLIENEVSRFIAPRGLAAFRGVLTESEASYAVTGAAASEEWTSVAPTRSMFVYVEDAALGAEAWGLRPTDAGVNVILLEPRKPNSVAFVGTGVLDDGVRRAAPVQVAADLLNGPGRDPQEGEELLRWMAENETAWRLP